jgi:hypothetical protein
MKYSFSFNSDVPFLMCVIIAIAFYAWAIRLENFVLMFLAPCCDLRSRIDAPIRFSFTGQCFLTLGSVQGTESQGEFFHYSPLSSGHCRFMAVVGERLDAAELGTANRSLWPTAVFC